MRNYRGVQLLVSLGAVAWLSACTSVAFNRSSGHSVCDVTPEALATVRYGIDAAQPSHVEVSCAPCDAVYVAAQHAWLHKTYPGRMWLEHFTAVPVVGSPASERDESCFRMPTAAGGQEAICFTNSERCDRETS